MKRLRASIRNIRRADDSVKRRFYYGGAVFFMALVIGGWFIFVQIYPPLPRANENVEEESMKEEKTSSLLIVPRSNESHSHSRGRARGGMSH
jgi:hypothetical protein